jgi:hypothetical protein
VRDLPDETVSVETKQDPADLGALSFGVFLLRRQMGRVSQPFANVLVGESTKVVSAVEDGMEELQVFSGQGVERLGAAAARRTPGLGDVVELPDLDRGVVDDSQRVQIA